MSEVRRRMGARGRSVSAWASGRTSLLGWLCAGLVVATPALPSRLAAQGVSGARDFIRVPPASVRWVRETDGSGVERATLFGDPSQPGIYVVRIKFPRGVMSRPHYHAEDRHATVIQGTWYTGTGDRFAPDETTAVPAGGYMLHPAGEIHFDGARDEEVIVQIIGYGPSSTVRLRPADGAFGPSLPR